MEPSRQILISAIAAISCIAACASQPIASATSQAPAPPPDPAIRYDILLADHLAGKAIVVVHPDRSIDEEYEFNDRGRGPKLHLHFDVSASGEPSKVEIAGKDYYKRDIREVASCEAERCKWDSGDDQGAGGRGFYLPLNSGIGLDGLLLAAALKPGGATLLPGGSLRARKVAEANVVHTGWTRHLNAYELSGLGFVPSFEWFEDDGTTFGSVDDWGSTVREGWGEVVPKLLEIQKPLGRAWREHVTKEVSHHPASVAIVHARLFDPATKLVTEDATILIDGNLIQAAGAKLPVPKGTEVIDAAGKFVMPGLWDMHVHLSEDEGLMHLSQGVTTVRDLGTESDSALARRARWDAETELGPRVMLAVLVDGRGPFQGPTKVLADTPEEAIQIVDEFAAKGYIQLKIYSSVKPEIVPVLIKEAHAKGMRVSGHIPAHMIAEDAINAGFDEVQHINFVMLDLLSTREDDTRTPLRFTRVAEKAAGLDLDSPAVNSLIELFARKHIVLDPTLSAFEDMFTIRKDHPSQAIAPLLSRLPAPIQRGAATGGLPVAEGMDATYRASFKRCEELVKRMWDRKVTIVAGTDGLAGFTLHRELELYAEAGIPNAEVLAIATLGAATVMKRESNSASIATGKNADLIIIDGDPLATMRDVRNVVTVIKAGTVIDAVALQKALSIAPR